VLTGCPTTPPKWFTGTPGQLERLCDAAQADELIIITITHNHADRVRSYRLLADEWARR
jgi:hypothetical protein